MVTKEIFTGSGRFKNYTKEIGKGSKPSCVYCGHMDKHWYSTHYFSILRRHICITFFREDSNLSVKTTNVHYWSRVDSAYNVEG